MESIKFLIEKLEELSTELPYLHIRYEYRSIANTHIVEVKPIESFDNDLTYIKKQIVLEELFEELFPGEEVLFMTENILIQVTNPILVLGVSDIIVDLPIIEFDKMLSLTEFVPEELKSFFSFMINDSIKTNNKIYYKCTPTIITNSEISNIYNLSVDDVRTNLEKSDHNHWYKPEIQKNNSKKSSEVISELFFINIAA